MRERRKVTETLYPRYGAHLNGGFLSHVAGKLIYRTGIEGFSVKIHNAFLGDQQNPGQQELSDTRLCHLHGDTWDTWQANYAYRKSKGAYRAELNAPFDQGKGGLNMHSFLNMLEAEGGTQELRVFYTEVCTARPDLLKRSKRMVFCTGTTLIQTLRCMSSFRIAPHRFNNGNKLRYSCP